MDSDNNSAILAIITMLAAMASIFLYVFGAHRRETRELKARQARAKQRREENERTAAVLLQEVLAADHARAVVAAQRQDTTAILVPVTPCDAAQRRRILRPEQS